MRGIRRMKPLAPESPVELFVNGSWVTTFMCTPLSLEELAAGYLCSTGKISRLGQIEHIAITKDMTSIQIKLSESEIMNHDNPVHGPIRWPVSLESLKEKAVEMFSKAELYRKTGGMHCAALWTSADIIITREDVGRHNAVDKVIGRAFLDGIDLSQAVLLTSGRFAADMVMKAKNAKIPLLVTRSIPTSAAYAFAVKAGITLVGRIESGNPIVYSHASRITVPVSRGGKECLEELARWSSSSYFLSQ